MSELTLTVMRLGFLAVLWLFVIVAVQVIRSDLFWNACHAARLTPHARFPTGGWAVWLETGCTPSRRARCA
ncbi:hypothetical protein SBADM41S_03681 [Streptomyces badius]